MISKMLVSIEDTESSQHALTQVSALARSEESQLDLLSVIPSYDGDLRFVGKKEVFQQMKSSYKKALETAENSVKPFKLNQKSILEEGEPYAKILSLSNKEHYDLIVVNSRTSLFGGLIPVPGNAGKVVSQSDTDILVIPERATLNLEHILLAYDDSIGANQALKRSIDICVAYGSKLTLVNVFDVPQKRHAGNRNAWDKNYREASQLLENAKKIAEKSGVRHLKTEIRRGNASWEICELARDIKAGLIMLGTNQKSALKKALMENVMEQVVRNESFPVWIVKK